MENVAVAVGSLAESAEDVHERTPRGRGGVTGRGEAGGNGGSVVAADDAAAVVAVLSGGGCGGGGCGGGGKLLVCGGTGRGVSG